MKLISVLITTLTLLMFSASAKTEEVVIKGNIFLGEFHTSKSSIKNIIINGVSIIVKENDTLLSTINTGRKNRYQITLLPDIVYTIEFRKTGYVSKIIEIDTKGMSEQFLKKGHDLFTDITLFKQTLNPDVILYSKAPVAKCLFNKRQNTLVWDMDYAKASHQIFVRLMSNNSYDYSFEFAHRTVEEEIDFVQELIDIDMMHLKLLHQHKNELRDSKALFKKIEKLNEPIPLEALSN